MMSRARRLLVSALLPCLLFPAAAIGNPVHPAGIHTHVQSADPYSWPDVTDCDQLVEWTPALGALEFDIYVELRYVDPPYNVDRASFDLEWPASWSFTGYDIAYEDYCAAAVTVTGNQATVNLEWSICPPRPYQLLPMIRCFLTATEYGRFDVSLGTSSLLRVCTPDDGYTDYEAYGALAGVVCAHGGDHCPLPPYDHCWPVAGLPSIELQVASGETLVEILPFEFINNQDHACPGECFASEPWMTVSCPSGNHYDFPVTLEIDASALNPGSYSGWVMVDSGGSRDCTHVELTVLDLTATSRSSWSLVKSLY